MSRIIKSLLNHSITKQKLNSAIVFLSSKPKKEILNLNIKLYSIIPSSHSEIKLITESIVNHCLSFLPDFVICENMTDYHNAKSLSNILRLPHVNIITEFLPIKPDAMLGMAREQLINDINLITDTNIAKKMCISNHEIISSNLDHQILNKVNSWKSV